MSSLFNGQAVKVQETHLQFPACATTVYHVASINRVNGTYSVNLLKDGKSVGVCPESKLTTK